VRLLGEDRQLRLVRRGCGVFEGDVLHRRARVAGPIGHLAAPLVHENVRSIKDVARRFRQYVPLEARAMRPRPSLWEVARIPPRMFRYYYLREQAWRDGVRGFATCAIYAVHRGVVAWVARRNPS
jgi:hypothetical protein